MLKVSTLRIIIIALTASLFGGVIHSSEGRELRRAKKVFGHNRFLDIPTNDTGEFIYYRNGTDSLPQLVEHLLDSKPYIGFCGTWGLTATEAKPGTAPRPIIAINLGHETIRSAALYFILAILIKNQYHAHNCALLTRMNNGQDITNVDAFYYELHKLLKAKLESKQSIEAGDIIHMMKDYHVGFITDAEIRAEIHSKGR